MLPLCKDSSLNDQGLRLYLGLVASRVGATDRQMVLVHVHGHLLNEAIWLILSANSCVETGRLDSTMLD